MALQLKPGESVIFPAPYVPTEPALTLVTTTRIVNFGDEGRIEMDLSKVSFTGKLSTRPLLVLGIILALIGAPLVLYGAYNWNRVKGMPTFEEQPPPPGIEAEDPADVRIKAVIFAVVGALFVGAAYLSAKKIRWLVLCRGDGKMMRIIVKDEMQQTQLLMTLQAMVQGAKAASAAMGPPPKA